MLDVVLIGYGAMGRNHARVLMDMDDVKLVGIAEPDKDNRAAAQKKFDFHVYEDYRRLCSEVKPKLAIIATPTGTHCPIALELLSRKIHCLVEKPVASTLDEANTMIQAAEKAHVQLAVGHVERFNPAVQLLKTKLDKNECGRIFKVEVNRAGPFPKRIRDVGVIIDLAVHDIDMINYLLGSRPCKVYAQTEKKIHTEREDLLTAIVTYEHNVIAQFNTNWLTPYKIRNLSITGERGLFYVDFLYQTLQFYENAEINERYTYTDIIRGVSEGAMFQYPVRKQEPLKLELENVASAIMNNRRPLITGYDGVKTLDLAFKMLESANMGTVVTLNGENPK